MTNQNEVQLSEKVVEETNNYVVKQLPDGSFKKQMKYQKFFTHIPQTQEEQILLYKVFNGTEEENKDIVTPFRNMIGKVIGIEAFYQMPFTSFDEQTGTNTPGVTTTIRDGDHFYTTSSKSVYHTLRTLCDTFGYPNEDRYKKIFVKITGTKRQNGVQIDLALEKIGE